MASSTTNRWKLGLFVVAGVAAGFATLLSLGRSRIHRRVRPLVTYVDESVQGLELGAPLKFRGVPVGAVKALHIAPDRRMVEIVMDVYVDVVERLGISSEEAREIRARKDIRLQIASSGITGVKYVVMDYFDPARFPPPKLPFDVPESYVPSTPSTMKSLEAGLTESLEKIPVALDHATALLTSLNKTVDDLDVKGLRDQIKTTLDRIDAILVEIDAKGLSRRASTLMEDLGALSGSLGPHAGDTLASLREAADSLRGLLRMLERDPQSLLYGKTPEAPPR
jgi:phospholipid/cholesterol/gamma-HCH transport system substrate-binding protein